MPALSPHPTTSEASIVAAAAHTTDLRSMPGLQPSIPEETLETVSKEKLANMTLMMRTFALGALREKEEGNPSRYNELIGLLMTDQSQPEAPSPLKFYVWIVVLTQCVSRLGKSASALVEALLRIDWAVQDNAFVDAYIGFLENLVSAHAFYAAPVLNAIVRGFRYRPKLPPYAKVTRSVVYERNHAALRSILDLIPTSVGTLYMSLSKMMPYYRLDTAVQATYIKNLLQVIDYVPYLRKQILRLVISHIVQIDVHIQIELDEVEDEMEFKTFHMDFDQDYLSEDSDSEDEEDEFEDDDDDAEVEPEEEKPVSKSKQERRIKSMVRRLDAMMLLVFRYLAKHAVESNAEERSELYHALVNIFDHAIVKTLKSRYTQFLLFYYSSLDMQVYPEHFVNHLIQHIADTSKPRITRIACAAYVSSYVARAKFMDTHAIQRTVNMLSAWCTDYVEQFESQVQKPDAVKYDIFYAVMQAIMYIFCFRWRELTIEDGLEASLIEEEEEATNNAAAVESHNGGLPTIAVGQGPRPWCLGLRNMPRLVMSRFNPLKVCSPMVVGQFARLAHDTNFMYVYPILEKNKDLVISGVTANATDGDTAKGKNILAAVQSFFPFDPYRLASSKAYIERIYFEWIADEDEEDEESSDEEEEEDEDMPAGVTAMSISPNPNKYLA